MVDENGLKGDIFKKLSSSFSGSDFPGKIDAQKLIHSVSSMRIKETSFITINSFNNNNSSKKSNHHHDVIAKERAASRIEI